MKLVKLQRSKLLCQSFVLSSYMNAQREASTKNVLCKVKTEMPRKTQIFIKFSSINLSARKKHVQIELQDALSAKMRRNQIHYLFSFLKFSKQTNIIVSLRTSVIDCLVMEGYLCIMIVMEKTSRTNVKQWYIRENYAEFYKQFGSHVMNNALSYQKYLDMSLGAR